MTKEEIFDFLKSVLVEHFEIDPSKITLQANLYTDLELDSIDAIDLIAVIKKKVGKEIDANLFYEVRTIEDAINIVLKLEANA